MIEEAVMPHKKEHKPARPAGPTHIFSVDVEEYFQVEGAALGGVKATDWHTYPQRLDGVLDALLDLLARHHAKATFFVLGWVAQHQAACVRRIAKAGHEVASHGMSHHMLKRLTPAQFRTELLESRKLLEDLTGKPVVGFRAPTFSIVPHTAWAIDVLADCGYSYDSSIFPIRRRRYGVPSAPRSVYIAVGPAGGRIVELPPLTTRLLGTNLPMAGGGYFRLFPLSLVTGAIRRAGKRGEPAMLYIHPWELDPHQPRLPMKAMDRWHHTVGLDKTQAKLERLFSQFHFDTAAHFLATWSCGAAETFILGNA